MPINNDSLIVNSIEKINYLARRGMLELDIILAPYLNNYYMKDNLENRYLFIELLRSEDNDLFCWLFKGVNPPEKYKYLINKIINVNKKFNEDNLK